MELICSVIVYVTQPDRFPCIVAMIAIEGDHDARYGTNDAPRMCSPYLEMRKLSSGIDGPGRLVGQITRPQRSRRLISEAIVVRRRAAAASRDLAVHG